MEIEKVNKEISKEKLWFSKDTKEKVILVLLGAF